MLADMLSATRLPECHRTRHVDVRPVDLVNANIPRRVNSLRVQVKVTRMAVTSCANGESTVFGVSFCSDHAIQTENVSCMAAVVSSLERPFRGSC
jgi:hypothetical protein